ncbi:MAG: hypothetical protein EOP07_17735, partial [Proteobacteria bacterium]
MKKLLSKILAIAALSLSSGHALAQDADAEEAVEEKTEVKEEPKAEVKSADYGAILSSWEKNAGRITTSTPRRWLFLQEQGGAYGAPSPLAVERTTFDALGWLELADPEAIRLFIQMNPTQKKAELKPEDLAARLKRYAELSQADGIVMKTNATPSVWGLYLRGKGFDAPALVFDKGPESLRQDLPARWLVQQFGYDALVVGAAEDYLILAKLKTLKRGAQGLILKKSSASIVADGEKDIGALLRVV